MKTLIICIICVSIHLTTFSQPQIIRVSDDIELCKISENAYMHTSYTTSEHFGRFPSNGLLFINGSEAFLFDTPMTDSLTEELVGWVRDTMGLNIVGFVPNHWHDDCMGGLGYLQSQAIESYAHQMTIDIAKTEELPLPNHGFTDSLLLQLGGKPIHCYYLGAAHSLDNIVVWIPSEQILFPGCIVKSIHSRGLGNVSDGNLTEYPTTVERIIDKFPNAQVVIPGHGPFGGPELLIHSLRLAGAAIGL